MILPSFKKYEELSGAFTVPNGLTVSFKGDWADVGANALLEFIDNAKLVSDNGIIKFINDTAMRGQAEAYGVLVDTNGITVRFFDKRGAINGAVTTALLLAKKKIPCCKAEDRPDFGYRSFMIDMARGLPKKEDVERAVRYMALAKFNTLHLHLSDSNGPCYVSDSLPEYKFIGKGDACDKQYLRDIANLCDRLGIDIVPEIEIPAHSKAFCLAYPEFACECDNISHWVMCPGSDGLFDKLKALIGEIAEIFESSKYIHVGSDELEFLDLAEKETPPRICYWDECQKCAKLREREGLDGRREEFYYLMNSVNEIVRSFGKRTVMWNDQIDVSKEVSLSRDILIQFWRVAGTGRGPKDGCSMQGFLDLGFEVINAYFPYTYVDVEKYTSSEKLKTWTPLTEPKVPEENSHLMIGGEMCAWEFGNYPEYPFYGYVIPAALAVFGNKLWNSSDVEYTDEYKTALFEFLFGFSADTGIFDCIGDIIPPRKKDVYSYVPSDMLDPDKISACIKTLEKTDKAFFRPVAESYIELLKKCKA